MKGLVTGAPQGAGGSSPVIAEQVKPRTSCGSIKGADNCDATEVKRQGTYSYSRTQLCPPPEEPDLKELIDNVPSDFTRTLRPTTLPPRCGVINTHTIIGTSHERPRQTRVGRRYGRRPTIN